MVRRIKVWIFSWIRRFYFLRQFRNIQYFLENQEIRHGAAELAGRRLLVLAPHPDDETIGCGGTVAWAIRQGAKADAIVMTGGDGSVDVPGEAIWSVRREEARRAAAVLGMGRIDFFDGVLGELHFEHRLFKPLAQRIVEGKYDVIFCPWPYDAQGDHRSTFKCLVAALGECGQEAAIWLYEVWSPLVANRLVYIDGTMDSKREAIRQHASPLAILDYRRKFEALAEYRALGSKEFQYAEAFFVTTPKDLFRFA